MILRITTLIVTFLLTSYLGSAQGGWQRIYPTFGGGVDGDGIHAVRQTPDGGYILGGIMAHNSGAHDNKIVKVDFQGEIQWEQTYSSVNNSSWVSNIELAPGGGFYVEGRRTSPITYLNEAYIQRIDANGNEIWVTFYPQATMGNKGSVTADGGYISCNYDYDHINFQDSIALIKTLPNGVMEWSKKYSNAIGLPHSVIELSTGEFMLEGYKSNQLFLCKFSATGDSLWHRTYGNQVAHPEYIGKVVENADGTLTLVGNDALSFGIHDIYLVKTDADGQLIWEQRYNQTSAFGTDLAQTADGGYILTGYRNSQTNPEVILLKVNSVGTQQWIKYYNGTGGGQWKPYSVRQTQDGGYIVGGARMTMFSTRRNMYLIKTDELGEIYSNTLQGHVFIDQNEDCVNDSGENGLANWLIEITGEQTFWTSTDANGFYWVRVDLGEYNVTVHPAANSSYWSPSSCSANTFSVNITDEYTLIETDLPQIAEDYCSLLSVSMNTPFLRRCFPNNYVVHYCNSGTDLATAVTVKVTFDEYLEVIIPQLTIPYTALGGNVYKFEVGDLPIGECGSFAVPVLVSCDAVLGQVHCSTAEIAPQTTCLLPDWNGPVIEAQAICTDTSVRFTLMNSGSAMNTSRNLKVLADNYIVQTDTYQLGAAGLQVIEIPFVNVYAYRIEAQQYPGYPYYMGDSIAVASVQGCDHPMPNGIIAQLPTYDGSQFIDVDCQQNIGAYDPNDKIGFPVGYGEFNMIEQNTEIEYRIRFQNTGTDTAFTVIIWDTLSPLLDVTSVRPGASSHNYTWRIFGENAKVLEFTFANILLPDSTTNEPGSIGFVYFKINQMPDNALGSVIHNRVGIFFDFNEPIFTNTTVHTIGRDFMTVSLLGLNALDASKEAVVRAYPNPFRDYVTFEVSGELLPGENYLFELHDVSGKRVAEIQSTEAVWTMSRNSLQSGTYFFSISKGQTVLEKGKLVVH
jgi:uncharacterized repeat protein (TIGR01451 family)